MSRKSGYFSAYLRQPMRSYDEVKLDQAEPFQRKPQSSTLRKTTDHSPAWKDSGDVEPRR